MKPTGAAILVSRGMKVLQAAPAAYPYRYAYLELILYRIQIFHPDSGFYLNTNHESEDLEALKSLLNEPVFAGPRYQIVDDEGTVHFGPTVIKRATPMTTEDLAHSFGVPVLDPREVGLFEESAAVASADMPDVGYTLQGIHLPDGSPIVSFQLNESQALAIMDELWPHVNFWSAPGGASMEIQSAFEAEAISKVLGNCSLTYQPGRHRWLFHVHLV